MPYFISDEQDDCAGWATIKIAADAVLDMAELKAVADVLYRLAEGGRKMDHGRRQLEIWGVPESFIVWMLRETPKGTSDER